MRTGALDAPAPDRAAPRGSSTRRADVSASATQTRPSPPTANPDGWANHASSGGPSSSPSVMVPASRRNDPSSSSNSHSVWLPAIATTKPARSADHATSHGDDSRTLRGPGSAHRGSSGPAGSLSGPPTTYCSPVPATVVTLPSARATPRSRWLAVSATTTS